MILGILPREDYSCDLTAKKIQIVSFMPCSKGPHEKAALGSETSHGHTQAQIKSPHIPA